VVKTGSTFVQLDQPDLVSEEEEFEFDVAG
jgi:hypothetical protein